AVPQCHPAPRRNLPAQRRLPILRRVSAANDSKPAFVREQDYAVRQHQGARENQEDSYALSETALPGDPAASRLLLVVGDGLGGHAGGSVASYLAVNAFLRSF